MPYKVFSYFFLFLLVIAPIVILENYWYSPALMSQLPAYMFIDNTPCPACVGLFSQAAPSLHETVGAVIPALWFLGIFPFRYYIKGFLSL